MSIIQGSSISAGSTESGAASFYDYPIEQSLRFDGASYLSRTPTTTTNSSRKTWTWSGWAKFTNINVGGAIFRAGTEDTNGNGFSHLGMFTQFRSYLSVLHNS